jgi:transposase-like protein
MTTTRNFNAEEKAKLTQIIREGSTIMQEVEDLNGSLSDTIKSVAEELQIKPTILKKAIAIAHKGEYQRHSEDWSVLEDVLAAVGKAE